MKSNFTVTTPANIHRWLSIKAAKVTSWTVYHSNLSRTVLLAKLLRRICMTFWWNQNVKWWNASGFKYRTGFSQIEITPRKTCTSSVAIIWMTEESEASKTSVVIQSFVFVADEVVWFLNTPYFSLKAVSTSKKLRKHRMFIVWFPVGSIGIAYPLRT